VPGGAGGSGGAGLARYERPGGLAWLRGALLDWGMAIVLVPGFMLDEGLWADVVEGLAPFEPVLFADLGRDSTIEAMAARVLAGAPARFAMIGFSMGGYIAREVAREAPGRVSALVLAATSARADTPERRRVKQAAAARLSMAAYGGVSRASVARAVHSDRAGDTALIERIRAMSIRLGQEAFARQSALDRSGDLGRLAAITSPTLVLAGSDDGLRSLAEAEELRAGIPGAVLQTIQGSGHMIPMEKPAAFLAAVVPFLAAHAARSAA
jgi:pimeloyl-ACP methyl ester carboxylesterase